MKMSAILIATAAMLGTTAPAFAASHNSDTGFKLTYNAKQDKYCTSQKVTGSRIPVQDCRSKSDWAKAGVVFADQSEPKLASK